MVRHHRDDGPVGASVLARRRPDLGNQLDRRLHPDRLNRSLTGPAARKVTPFPDGDLDSAAGLPGPAHAPAPVSNTAQPLRSPHSGAAQAADTAARSPHLTMGSLSRADYLA